MVNSKDIPKYLKENAKFCNWKYETRDGRLTKVPYNPHTNNKASVNNANTFTDFNSVVNGLDIYIYMMELECALMERSLQ